MTPAPLTRLRLALLLLAWSAPANADTTLPSARSAGAQRRWEYAGGIGEHDSAKLKAMKVALIEVGRRTVGRFHLVDLVVELEGRQVTDQWAPPGFPRSILGPFPDRFSLVTRGDASWMIADEWTHSVEELGNATSESEGCRRRNTTGRRPAAPPEGEAYCYREKVGAFPSVCHGDKDEFPDPHSPNNKGRKVWCFAPGVGISRLWLDSPWGRYDFQLMQNKPPRN